MTKKTESGRKGRVYAGIIGLVLAANILLSAMIVFINYPTEAHRATARQLDVVSMSVFSENGSDFSQIMESEEYKKLTSSSEANYTNIATIYTLVFNLLASIAIIGAVYYYLRKHRIANKVVGATVLLVSLGQLLTIVFTPFATAWYLGSQMPGIGSFAFMLFIGIFVAPLIVAVIAKIFDWQYGRMHSFAIN